MKPTTRGTLAAVVTGVAAAVGAAATPAAAAGSVPVPVPLGGISQSLGTQVPEASLDVPLLTPGTPEGPRYATGRLLPEGVLPQVPIGGTLPGADLHAPLPRLLGEGFDHLDVDAPAAGLHTLGPGLDLDAPLTQPDPDNFGLPALKAPEAGLLAPVLRTAAGAGLGTGSGR
ncbi:hypothetical protein FRZ03_25840 [Streptomyces misionensis]|uniref:Secreted protein n=1 Tax=Streptomyces misionensis TaxID=67331 RepID=A0A5C6J574_9ACTN|nr:hypothetical protein [Streptomyces misionensis]TWV36160.1 hypothetical protein FRZ03_25840 [Streptomyces misionensis]